MWKCPACERLFKNTNQWHSCYKLDVEDHLFNKSPLILALYELVQIELAKLIKYETHPVKSSILYKNGATFLSLKLKSERIELEFQTPYEIKGDRVKVSKRVSKNRVWNWILIDDIDEFDEDVKKWIKDSYLLISGK